MNEGKGRGLVLVLITLLVSVSLLFINQRWVKDNFLSDLFMTIAISGITTGIFSVFSFFVEKNNITDQLNSNFSILKRCYDYGLEDILTNFPFENEKIREDFINSKQVYILMNDGKNFISSNINMLNERLNQKKKETNFILLDYEQSDTMSVLTRKNEHDANPNYYIDKIQNVIDYHLKKGKREESHILKAHHQLV